MSVEVDIHKLEECFSKSNLRLAKAAYVQAAADASNSYCPVMAGSLHGSMARLEDAIEWRQEYAQYVYYMDDESTHWNSPNRVGTEPHSHWFEYAKEHHAEEWARAFIETALRPLGRRI